MTMTAPDDRVLLRQLPAETRTSFGLEIPEVAQEAPLLAIVLAVGRGTPRPKPEMGDGHDPRYPLGAYVVERNAMPAIDEAGHVEGYIGTVLDFLEVGDQVVIPRYGGTEIEAEEGGVIISILASEVLARVDVVRACRVCGCTDDEACEGGCQWDEADLCTRCA